MYYLVHGQMVSSATAVVSSANSKSTRRLMQSATPAPTEPESITCTEQNYLVSGDYNDEMLIFYINVTYPSVITIDARNSTAVNADDYIGIELIFPDTTDPATDGDTEFDQFPFVYLLLRVGDLDEGIYRLYYFVGSPIGGQDKYGTFVLSIRCDAIPTSSPTSDPTTPSPTPSPTAYPTTGPTKHPTIDPTPLPTKPPTPGPTDILSTSSSTIEPTFELFQCEDQCTEEYDPYCCNGDENFDNRCLAECIYPTGSTWNCEHSRCETADPSRSPSTEPSHRPTPLPTTSSFNGSPSPSMEPTTEPTTEPTIEPTMEPTIEPTTTIDLDSGTNRTVTFGSVLTIAMTIFFAVSVLLCICGLSFRYFIGQKRIHQKPEYVTVDVPAKVVVPGLPGTGADGQTKSYDIGERLQSWRQKSVDTPDFTEYPLALRKRRTDLKVSVSNIGNSPTCVERTYTLKPSVKTGATVDGHYGAQMLSSNNIGNSPTQIERGYSTMKKSPGIAGRLKEWANVGQSSRNQYVGVSTSDDGNSTAAQTSQGSYDIGERLQSWGQKSVDTPMYIEKINANIGTSSLKSSVKTGATVERIDELSPIDTGNSPMTCLLQPTATMDTTRTANNISASNIGNSPTSPLCMVESIPDTEDMNVK